jgi:uncharacterized membrane protein
VVSVATALLVIAFRGLRVKMAAAGLVALAAFALAGAVVYPAFGIKKASSSLAYGTFYGDIGVAYADAPTTFTAADTAVMSEVAPLATWRAAKNCYSSDGLFTPAFDRREAEKLRSKLRDLWIRVVHRTPITVVRTRLCRSSVAWNPLPAPRSKASFGEAVLSVPANLWGRNRSIPRDIWPNLTPHPISGSLFRLAYALQDRTRTWLWQPLIWRGALWCYVAYLAVAVAAVRLGRRQVLVAGVACVANQITVLAANPAQLYRYMAGPIFIGMVLTPLVAVAAAASYEPARTRTAARDRTDDVEEERLTSRAGDLPTAWSA